MPEKATHRAGWRSRRAVVAFGRFWWDFFVGDGPELLIGVVVAMGAVALLVAAGAPRALTVAALPVLTVGLLTLSVARARRRA